MVFVDSFSWFLIVFADSFSSFLMVFVKMFEFCCVGCSTLARRNPLEALRKRSTTYSGNCCRSEPRPHLGNGQLHHEMVDEFGDEHWIYH